MHRNPTRLVAAASVAAALVLGGCSRDLSTLEPAKYPATAPVFDEGFTANVAFQAFGDSKVTALSIDSTVRRSGASSVKISVPSPGDPAGGYAGGAFVDNIGRDLSGFTALTFWARSSIPATLDVAGIGNDNTGRSRFTAQTGSFALTPTWRKYIIPLPDPARLDQERGLFYFAEGPENGVGYDIWFDEARFETLASLGAPRPAIPAGTRTVSVGQTVRIDGTTTTFTIDGAAQTFATSPSYFTFASSNTAVATVGADGTISVVGNGTAQITATLGDVPATGTVVLVASSDPTTPAPTPTRLAADVISLFSNAYTNRQVDTWSAGFDQADVTDIQIAGNDTKKYTSLVFAGIEFTSQPVNATSMTGFHLDVLLSDAAAFRVKLVDFGANGAFGGGDDTEHEVTLSPSSTPGLVVGAWNSLDLPFTLFPGLTSRGNLAQLIISGSSSTVYLDNVYFYRTGGGTPTSPTVAAPTPTQPAGSVTSLFSDAYTNVTVDTWSAGFDQADVADTVIAGNNVKKYSNIVFAAVEATSQPIDASARTRFRMDIWTPNATAAPAAFRVKLVDFGANRSFGGGDDVEHELTFTAASTPALATGQWVSLDVPLSAFTGLVTRSNIAQLIISGSLGTVYVDNVYFYGAPATAPNVAAPTPTFAPSNVISMFSNAYTNVAVDTWSAVWDNAEVADTAIAGNAVKKYSGLVFAGIEATSAPINAAAMTHFMMDVWTPSPTADPAVFRIKLVDFGANGAFGGGDDVEHEVTLSAASTPALATGQWVRLELPFSAFPGLVTRGHIAQLIISGNLPTLYVDNVLFRN